MLAGPDDLALLGDWGPGEELSLIEIVTRYLPDADLVVAEGYKAARVPKIEVYRPSAHSAPLYSPGSEDAGLYLAIVTDALDLEADVPVLDMNRPDLGGLLADLVERSLLAGAGSG